MTKEQIARICHQANKTYCETLGDFSQMDWESAPDWQKQSCLAGVEIVLATPKAPASFCHESWMQTKADEGWRYGPIKDAEKKEHPCMLPFHLLPKEQQAKDHLFRSIVLTLAPFFWDSPVEE